MDHATVSIKVAEVQQQCLREYVHGKSTNLFCIKISFTCNTNLHQHVIRISSEIIQILLTLLHKLKLIRSKWSILKLAFLWEREYFQSSMRPNSQLNSNSCDYIPRQEWGKSVIIIGVFVNVYACIVIISVKAAQERR